MEDLQVLEDRVGELEAGGPSPAVQEFGLHPSPEGLDDGVVVGVTDGAHRGQQPGLLGALGERPGGVLPGSEWMTVPLGGVRVWMAIPRALVTSAAVGAASIDQPTTRREKLSSTTAQ
jgi:hypothetical protein